MKPRDELIDTLEYVKTVKKLLPAHAFSPAPERLWVMFMHVAVVAVGYAGIRWVDPIWSLFFSILIGHSVACIGFLAHELSHHAIITNRPARYLCEIFFWGLILVPTTLWKRIHNQTHHSNANTRDDPDRQFLKSEESFWTKWYTWLFYPNNRLSRYNPLVGIQFITYIIRQTSAAFYRADRKPDVVPFKPAYRLQQKIQIVAEIIIILLMQMIVFFVVGGEWTKFLWASPISYFVTSTIVMMYIFTNHALNPLCETNDPLISSTSVVVPPLMDRIHHHFSHHSEHHLFPSMNSDYYPEVCKILKEKFPDRYNSLPLTNAWMKLWRSDKFPSDAIKGNVPADDLVLKVPSVVEEEETPAVGEELVVSFPLKQPLGNH